LTASRGALLAIAGVLLVFLLRVEKKAVGLLVVVLFGVTFIWQAGDIMKSRSATIQDYEEEDSAAKRLDAWEASIGMMLAHPLTGVGFASFGQAFPDFSDSVPRIAHNTFFQIAGEYGIIGAGAYLVLLLSTLNRLRKNGIGLRAYRGTEPGWFYYCLNEACLLGLTGFFVCALFLSLETYDIFYYLLILANGTLLGSAHLMRQRESEPGVDRMASLKSGV
jgi:O-antigen ligase